MTEPTVALYSHGLLSKWGMGDGQVPDAVMDYCDEHGIDWSIGDWEATLQKLVRTHLLPAMQQHHTGVELLDISTSHNPIRLVRVDGRNVEDETNGWHDDIAITLRPEWVDVPVSVAVQTLMDRADV